ncbi:hypothetical protein TWF569_002935 [Orbilia oligospora]|nr:hypothetical protein TWF594_006264 [Orbilia oligospora]KAF3152630.1 hypothetical protein TWF569_002935 [Orbilia oligospora]
MARQDVTNASCCNRGGCFYPDADDGDLRYLGVGDRNKLDRIDDSYYTGPFTAHLATGTDFQFGIVRQLPLPLVDHSFYLKTLYGANGISWPVAISLSFPTVTENKASCILPAHKRYSGDGLYGKMESFPHTDGSRTTTMRYYGLASLLFVLYGVPIHLRCLLVADMENLNLDDKMNTCPVLLDSRLFDGTNLPFRLEYPNPGLSIRRDQGSSNSKYLGGESDFELSIYLTATPVFSEYKTRDSKWKRREATCSVGVSFDLQPAFNQVFAFNALAGCDQVQRALMLGRIALMELRRFNDLCGVIFDHSKIAIRGNFQYFHLLNKVTKRRKSLKIANIEYWDDIYDELVLHLDGQSMKFMGIELEDLVQYREWISLLDQMDGSAHVVNLGSSPLGTAIPIFCAKPSLLHVYSSEDEASARVMFRTFLIENCSSQNLERTEYKVREARLPCQHFLPPGFALS